MVPFCSGIAFDAAMEVGIVFQVISWSEWLPPGVSHKGIITGGTISQLHCDTRRRNTEGLGEAIVEKGFSQILPKKTHAIMTKHHCKTPNRILAKIRRVWAKSDVGRRGQYTPMCELSLFPLKPDICDTPS